MSPRVAVKAIIERDGNILVNECAGSDGNFYLLPGGGIGQDETAPEALARECAEEVDAQVEVGDLAFVREYIADRHPGPNSGPAGLHQIDLIFWCSVPDDYDPRVGREGDPGQVAVRWLRLESLRDVAFYPTNLVRHLQQVAGGTTYLGEAP